MKLSVNVLVILLLGTIGATGVYAQSPREQLQQLTAQLQKTPNDNALRERIIKLGAEIKPAPAIPDEAVRLEGRAQFAFKNAKSEADYLDAAREYEAAVRAAPWVPGYYSDLCTIYEKAGKFEDANRHCGFYLIGLTDPAQMTDVKRRIAGLEFGIEKANSQARETALLRKKQEEKLRTTEGVWYSASTALFKVIQQNGRFEAKDISGGNFVCAKNLKATATTIEWVGGAQESSGICNYSYAWWEYKCQLSGETTLDCQAKGFGRATGRPESPYQMNRR